MNIPRPLKPGMTIALVAPSGAPRSEEVLPRAAEFWKRQGYRVVTGESCTARHGYLAGPDELRAKDLNRFFADDSVDAIFCLRGGYGAARILPLLDYACIRRYPKIFVGFSDITALHSALNRYGRLVTFHGPNADLALDMECSSFSLASLMTALTRESGYTLQNPDGYPRVALQGGRAVGEITGGNLTVLAHSLGTPWAPEFSGRILFLEDIHEPTYRVDETLMNLKHAGAFEQCAGILLGEFTDCQTEDPAFGLSLEDILTEIGFPKDKPVLRGIRAGHCTPKLTIPLGVMAEMDADAQTVRLLNGAVRSTDE